MNKQLLSGSVIVGLFALLPLVVSANDSIVFSPDGNWFAIGKQNGAIELRKLKTGDLLAAFTQLKKPPDPASAINWRPNLAISPDGSILASASGSSPVTLWDVKSRETIKILPKASVGYQLTFSNDGSLLAGIGRDTKVGPHRLTLWDTMSGKIVKTLTLELRLGREYSRNRILRAHFPESGGVLAVETVDDGIPFIRIWDTNNGRETVKAQAEAWALSPDGKYVVTRTPVDKTGLNNRHTVWSAPSGKIVNELPARTKDQEAE